LSEDHPEAFHQLIPCVKSIIQAEFGAEVVSAGSVLVPRNAYKPAWQYCYEALEELGGPSNMVQIAEKVTELNPGYKADFQKLHVIMLHSHKFLAYKEKKIYALLKWKFGKAGVELGLNPITETARQFLNNYGEPIPRKEIVNHVIKQNLGLKKPEIIKKLEKDKDGAFRFFENSKIGLLQKVYHHSFIPAPAAANPK
jgi:hypothetical protein